MYVVLKNVWANLASLNWGLFVCLTGEEQSSVTKEEEVWAL